MWWLSRTLTRSKYITQVVGLLLRVPLLEPNNSLRDLDAFQPLLRNDQLMSSLSAEDKALLGNVLIQTPAYNKSLKTKYKEAYLPAIEGTDKEVLSSIREDPQRYQLPLAADDEQTPFPAPTLILCGRQDEVVGYRDSLRLLELYPRSTFVVLDRGTHALPVDENELFEALVHNWLTRVHEWRG